jgi:hypothetical protein
MGSGLGAAAGAGAAGGGGAEEEEEEVHNRRGCRQKRRSLRGEATETIYYRVLVAMKAVVGLVMPAVAKERERHFVFFRVFGVAENNVKLSHLVEL